MTNEEIIQKLKPGRWPETRPDLKVDWHGWFGTEHQQRFRQLLPPEPEIIVEVGSWLGCSTNWFCETYPTATVIAIDTWRGSEEHQGKAELKSYLRRLWDQFVTNCWPHRDRLIPLRGTSHKRLEQLGQMGLRPTGVYIDGGHDTKTVRGDIVFSSRMCDLIFGDDFARYGVTEAVIEQAHGRLIEVAGHVWNYRPGGKWNGEK